AFLVLQSGASGQAGAITGTAVDTGRKPVVNASVNLAEETTQASFSTVTNSAGRFMFPEAPPVQASDVRPATRHSAFRESLGHDRQARGARGKARGQAGYARSGRLTDDPALRHGRPEIQAISPNV